MYLLEMPLCKQVVSLILKHHTSILTAVLGRVIESSLVVDQTRNVLSCKCHCDWVADYIVGPLCIALFRNGSTGLWYDESLNIFKEAGYYSYRWLDCIATFKRILETKKWVSIVSRLTKIHLPLWYWHYTPKIIKSVVGQISAYVFANES